MQARVALVIGVLAASCVVTGVDTPAGALGASSARVAGLVGVQALPSAPRGSRELGPLAGATELSMRVVLEPRDPAALSSFIAGTSDPSSSSFRRFLPRGAFARRFGPTSAAVAAVRDAVEADGLQATSLSASHLVLTVRGPAAGFALALHAQVQRWQLPDGALRYRLARAARLPARLARFVAGIVGVSTLVAEHSFARRAPLGAHARAHVAAPTPPSTAGHGRPALQPQTCTAAQDAIDTFGDGTFTPTQEGDAYGLANAWDHGYDGTGHTVALLEFAPYASSDVLAYDKCFQLISPSATKDPNVHDIDVDGGTSPGSSSASDEPTLDIEELRALSPGAQVDVYLGPNNVTGPVDTLQRIATDDTAQSVSISWGICEQFSDHAAETPIFEQLAAQGQTVFAATGDSGSSDCYGQSPPSGPPLVSATVDDPSSQPLVTGVGGLTVNSLSPLQESVWNDCVTFDSPGCLGGAGGGGISQVYPRPAWQSAPGAPTGARPGATARLVPDVSVMGDPSTGMLAYYQGQFEPFGGTSMGAPLMAALDVVAAQSCAATTFGFLNPLLYAMGRHGGDFDDVTSGNNAIATSTLAAHEFEAGTGYDMASGLGSPDPTNFLPALCDGPATATATPTTPDATSSWTVTFHAGAASYPAGAHVTITAPDNTSLPSSTSAWSVADTSGTDAPQAVSLRASPASHVQNVATLTLAQGAVALADVSVTATGVTNPPVVGTASVSVTDSVDALASVAPLALSAVAPAANHGVVTPSRTSAPVGGSGIAVTTFAGDAGGLGVAGARLTATTSGHGWARFTSRRTNDLGVGTLVVRDDHVERTTITVRADGVVVEHATVAFTDPWHARALAATPHLGSAVGTPATVPATTRGAGELVLARTAADRLLVGTVVGGRLADAVLPLTASLPAAASSPTLAWGGSWLYAAYRSTGGHLIVLRQHGGNHLHGWLGVDVTAARAAPHVTGDPRLLVVGGATAHLSIASVSASRDVVRTTAALRAATRFTTVDLTRAAHRQPDAVGDVAEVEVGTSDEFLYRTTGGSLEVLAVLAGRWEAMSVPDNAMVSTVGGGAVRGDPTATVADGLVTVAATTASHRVDVFVGTFDAWSGGTVTQGAAGASAPAGSTTLPGVTGDVALRVHGALTQVFCRTTSGSLLELSSDGVVDPWSSFDLTTLARAPRGLGGVAVLAGSHPALLGSFGGLLAVVAGGVAG